MQKKLVLSSVDSHTKSIYSIYMGPHIISNKEINRLRLNDTRAIMDSFRTIVQGLRNSSRQSHLHAGLTSAQFFVLQQIKSRNGLSLNELAELTFTHQSTVSETVGRLVSLHLVSKLKSKSDSRSLVLSVTKNGAAKLRSSSKTAQQSLIESVLSLPKAKRGILSKLLNEVVSRTNFSKQPPSLFFEEKTAN
jgi:DNA-binding MarR family transcriptional regulator